MKATLVFAIAPVLAFTLHAGPIQGLWDASVVVNGVEVPFRFEISGDGSAARGSFFNGDEKVTATSGSFQDGALSLKFDHYATRLEATLKDGALDGKYVREGKGFYPFHATPHVTRPAVSTRVPDIGGLWEIAVKSPKGESAWRFLVRQSGPEVSAAILRVDGDTGTLTGTYQDGKFRLSHFSGARPLLLDVMPKEDGSLEIVQNGKTTLTAVRPSEARSKGLGAPTDPSRHTSMKDPDEPFRFSFPDLNGRLLSNTDRRFLDKVVIVAISGSWCPNCHDEAPFLEELYRKYRGLGLEVVSLSFEEGEQLKDPARLRAFVRQYAIDYPVLLAGDPADLKAKVPQAVNLDAWPTTFYLGRDGRVRSVHAGFAGRASGALHEQMKEEISSLVERLLAEQIRTSR